MNDITCGTSGGQGQSRRPRLEPGCIYSRQDVLANLRITAATLKSWCDGPNGLQPITPPNTRSQYFFSDDLMLFFTKFKGSNE